MFKKLLVQATGYIEFPLQVATNNPNGDSDATTYNVSHDTLGERTVVYINEVDMVGPINDAYLELECIIDARDLTRDPTLRYKVLSASCNIVATNVDSGVLSTAMWVMDLELEVGTEDIAADLALENTAPSCFIIASNDVVVVTEMEAEQMGSRITKVNSDAFHIRDYVLYLTKVEVSRSLSKEAFESYEVMDPELKINPDNVLYYAKELGADHYTSSNDVFYALKDARSSRSTESVRIVLDKVKLEETDVATLAFITDISATLLTQYPAKAEYTDPNPAYDLLGYFRLTNSELTFVLEGVVVL